MKTKRKKRIPRLLLQRELNRNARRIIKMLTVRLATPIALRARRQHRVGRAI